jgi:hypothetical protein
VHPRHADPRSGGELLQASGGGVPVHAPAHGVAQDGAVLAAVDRLVDGAGDRGWQRHEHDFAALAAYAQDAVAVFFAEVAEAGAAGFEDPHELAALPVGHIAERDEPGRPWTVSLHEWPED